MRKERDEFIELCREFVRGKEKQYKAEHLALGKALVQVDLYESKKELKLAQTETERMKTEGLADEEEVRIFVWQKNESKLKRAIKNDSDFKDNLPNE